MASTRVEEKAALLDGDDNGVEQSYVGDSRRSWCTAVSLALLPLLVPTAIMATAGYMRMDAYGQTRPVMEACYDKYANCILDGLQKNAVVGADGYTVSLHELSHDQWMRWHNLLDETIAPDESYVFECSNEYYDWQRNEEYSDGQHEGAEGAKEAADGTEPTTSKPWFCTCVNKYLDPCGGNWAGWGPAMDQGDMSANLAFLAALLVVPCCLVGFLVVALTRKHSDKADGDGRTTCLIRILGVPILEFRRTRLTRSVEGAGIDTDVLINGAALAKKA